MQAYLLNSVVQIDPKIKTIINVVVVAAACIWLLDVFVVDFGTVGRVRVRH